MSRTQKWALGLCLFCVVVGARWALYYRYGTDLPWTDQWDAEGLVLFFPRSIGRLHFSGFYWPHNEHRLALTRLIAYGLTLANGQWDQRLEATFNASIPGGIALFLWCVAAPRLKYVWQVAAWVLIAALYALPVAWENILSGFASQQFLLIGLALVALKTLPFGPAGRAQWWIGAACVVLSLGSMASGFFVAAIILVMVLWQVARGGRSVGAASPTLIVCLGAVATGILSRNPVPSTEVLKAHSVTDFLLTAAKTLGWPAYEYGWRLAGLVLLVPYLVVLARTLKGRQTALSAPVDAAGRRSWHEFLCGAGGWVILQALAMAYARGAGGPEPASRYVETLIVGLIVNFLCLAALEEEPVRFRGSLRWLRLLEIVWGTMTAMGVAQVVTQAYLRDVPPFQGVHRNGEYDVRGYLTTGDADYLNDPWIPYPSAQDLKRDLDIKGIATILPVSVRVPLPLEEVRPSDGRRREFGREDSRRPKRLQGQLKSEPGFPPALPVLTNAIAFGSYQPDPAHRPNFWTSWPQPPEKGTWLKFEVAGDFNDPGIKLELHSVATGRLLGTVRPDKNPGNTWRSAYVKAPREEYVVTAADQSRVGWMAFSAPTEMGWASYRAWRWIRHGTDLAVAGLVGALGLLVWPAFQERGRSRTVKKPLPSPRFD